MFSLYQKPRKYCEFLFILFYFVYFSKPTEACGGINGNGDNSIVTNPTFTWRMNPPVSWTYPDQNAIQLGTNLPGQPLMQTDAQNNANGDMMAATLQGLATAQIPTAGVRVIPNYTPPNVNDCQKAMGATGTPIGQAFGLVELGAVVNLVSSTMVVTIANCAARSFLPAANPLTFQPFIQSASVQVQGVQATRFQLQQVAAEMMVALNFNNRVRFVDEITIG